MSLDSSTSARLAAASQQALPSTQEVPFLLENLQHLSVEDAVLCQQLMGHGSSLGVWETPKDVFGHIPKADRRVDLRARLKNFLPEDLQGDPGLPTLLDEAVLYLTRYALLMRLGPATIGKHSRNESMKASTVAHRLNAQLPKLVARGLERRLRGVALTPYRFADALSDSDLKQFASESVISDEVSRLRHLTAKGMWSDEPHYTGNVKATTTVRGEEAAATPERRPAPYQPLPDEYMEQIGPRVVWLIKDLGPNLIHLLEHLLNEQRARRFKWSDALSRRVVAYFKKNLWRDRHGIEIKSPPFPLLLVAPGKRRSRESEAHAWPPRLYAHVVGLAATLQRAHIFMALLLMTSRQSEMSDLKRDCVEVAEDGNAYVNGKTYKPTKLQQGKDRKWPVPSILVYAIAQQVELVQVSERLSEAMASANGKDDLSGDSGSPHPSETPAERRHLWASLGLSGMADATASLEDLRAALLGLARDVGLDEKPGGINLHPHRLRKTMARLAGVALEGSQKVVMLLLGHEDVRTALYYMQTDPGFRQEVEDVIREIRIIRSSKVIESMHAALHEPGSLQRAGHGGGGASVLEQAVVQHEERLHRNGRRWGADSARELAAILTDNGRSSRLVAPGVLCTKSPGEVGMCTQKRGEVSPGNCKVECSNHIELATNRRDVLRVIPILVENARAYFDDGEWLSAAHAKSQLRMELSRFDDIGAEFMAKPEVQAVLAMDPEGGS